MCANMQAAAAVAPGWTATGPYANRSRQVRGRGTTTVARGSAANQGEVRRAWTRWLKTLDPEMTALKPTSENILAPKLKAAVAVDTTEEVRQLRTREPDLRSELAGLVGLRVGTAYLWQFGSVINWVARANSYPDGQTNEGQSRKVYEAVDGAARLWEAALGGRIAFNYTTDFDTSAFEVRYEGESEFAAEALFPDDYRNPLNVIKVYRSGAESSYESLVRLYTHELGHILGLRHEHSQAGDGFGNGPEDDGSTIESLLFGIRNPASVMGYPPLSNYVIQDSNRTWLVTAYDTLGNGTMITREGRFGTVAKTVFRVAPDN